MKRIWIAVACAAIGASPVRADQATAAAAFNQAEAFAKQGKWAEACPLYETSYNADAQIGVLLHLADCHEHLGRNATAWAEFISAVELAHAKSDPREAFAKGRADSLLPKLAKLTLTPPPTLIPGLGVRRDNVDITALVGTEIPIDPGDHVIVANAPGYIEWKHPLKISGPGTTSIAIPVLEKLPPNPIEPIESRVREGTLIVLTRPGARILIDAKEVGRNGHFEGKLKVGGHTLRVVSEGMRPYQSEVVVGEGRRSIDVQLERALVFGSPKEDSDSFEVGASLGTGIKLRGDRPLVATVRAELALRLGRRVNLGTYVEYGDISTADSCGFDGAGPMPSTPFDFGERNQFRSCSYLMVGPQLYVHVLPKRRLDPYLGLAPGFRFGSAEWTPYRAGEPQPKQSGFFPSIVVGFRGGLNYHPRPSFAGWQIGAYVEAAYTVVGDEKVVDSDDGNSEASFLSLFGGLRSTVAF